MMHHTTVRVLGRARLADLHHQAQRAALAPPPARPAGHAGSSPGDHSPGLFVAVIAWVRRPRPAPESP
jgi:hypothetical protein